MALKPIFGQETFLFILYDFEKEITNFTPNLYR